MRTRSLIPAAVLLFGCSIRHRPVAPEPVRGPTRDSLFQLDQTRDDSIGLFGDDVIYLRAGAPLVFGRSAVRALLAAPASPGTESMSWQPLGGGVSRDLRAGYTYGVVARVTHPQPPRRGVRLERYVAYWERAAGGPWHIAAYGEVAGPAIAESALPRDHGTPPDRPLPKALAGAVAKVRETDSLFSDMADRMGSVYAFTDAVAPDGVVFGNPQLVVGPTAVHDYYTAEANRTALTWHPVFASVAGSADLGYTVGEYSTTSRGPSGAAVQRFGKYLTIWTRQPNGQWKFAALGSSGMPAKAAAP